MSDDDCAVAEELRRSGWGARLARPGWPRRRWPTRPTMVRLPPRQAPSASAHQSGVRRQARRDELLDDRDGGGRVGDVVDDGRGARREPQQRHRREPASPPVASAMASAMPPTMPTLHDGLDEDEQADEEEQRRPLHLAERLVGVQAADEHQHGGARAARSSPPPGRAAVRPGSRRSSRPRPRACGPAGRGRGSPAGSMASRAASRRSSGPGASAGRARPRHQEAARISSDDRREVRQERREVEARPPSR